MAFWGGSRACTNRAGLSLLGQSVIYKSKGERLKKWFLWGTLSLVVFNAGLCIFGNAVKARMILETKYEQNGH